MTRPETMQPARATAVAAASLVDGGVVLLPHGNDGVGIVGAFAIESPPTLRLLVIDHDESPAEIRARARPVSARGACPAWSGRSKPRDIAHHRRGIR